jgi:hypothetical protein
MISDVLFEAVEQIDQYLYHYTHVYKGETREHIVQLRDDMIALLAELDEPPHIS